MKSVRALPIVAVLIGLAVAVDVFWLASWGIASPARGLLGVLAACLVGDAVLRLPRRRNVSPFDAFVVGVIVFAFVFAFCVRFVGVRAFAPVAWVLTLASLAKARPRRWLERRIPSAWLVAAPIFFVLVVRAAWFTDRLELTVPVQDAFPWIDTPLWFSLTFGAERSIPPAELLVAGHTVNYHFGSGLVIAWVRNMLGMPMPQAYFAAVVIFETALGVGLARIAGVFFRARRPARMAATFLTFVLLEHMTFNFPTVVALPLLLGLLLQVLRFRRLSDGPLIALGALFLMITKEVDYLFFFVIAGMIGLFRFLARREWLSGVVVAVSFVLTRPFYDRLIRIDQRALLRPFTEHAEFDWLRGALANESYWIVAALLAALYAFARRRTHRRIFLAIVAALPAFVLGLLLCWFIKPTFVPPMDPFSYGWILFDMGQFVVHGKFVLGVVLALALFSVTLGDARSRHVRLEYAAVGALVFYGLLNMWRTGSLDPRSDRPENRGPDAVVTLLARVDPATAIIASDRVNWNHENPHWAAFFGHRFFFLREGRWVTAYADYAARQDAQRTLFTTADAGLARDVTTKHGITHLIASAQRPVPWLAGRAPSAQSGEYSLYVTSELFKP